MSNNMNVLNFKGKRCLTDWTWDDVHELRKICREYSEKYYPVNFKKSRLKLKKKDKPVVIPSFIEFKGLKIKADSLMGYYGADGMDITTPEFKKPESLSDIDDSKIFKIKSKNYNSYVSAESKESLILEIKNYLEKFVDSEDFFENRLNLWKNKYAESEFNGTLDIFLSQHPRPERVQKKFKVGVTVLSVYDFLPENRHERIHPFFNPFHFEKSSYSEVLRKNLNKLKLEDEIISFADLKNNEIKGLTENWEWFKQTHTVE